MNIIEQFDSVALAGLENLRLVASGAIDEKGGSGQFKSAATALKAFDGGTRRLAAQNNRLTVVLRTAKAVGVQATELRPFWRELSGASSLVAAKPERSLAAAKSKG